MKNINQINRFRQLVFGIWHLAFGLLTTLTMTSNMEGSPVLFNSDPTLTNLKCSLMPFSSESNPMLDVVKATIAIKKKHSNCVI
jgi:hypothetical protein